MADVEKQRHSLRVISVPIRPLPQAAPARAVEYGRQANGQDDSRYSLRRHRSARIADTAVLRAKILKRPPRALDELYFHYKDKQ